jgi:Flp pilus assembly protein TadG
MKEGDSRVMKFYRKIFKNSKGTVAVEFAIVLPFLFLLLSGVVNFGLILANQTQLNSIIVAGLLYAYSQPSSATQASIQNAMSTATSLSPLTVTATIYCECVDTSQPGCSSTCTSGITPGTYVTATAQSQVSLPSLDFALPNPFITNANGTIRIK